MQGFLGIDVGSVSTNVVVLDEKGGVLESLYIRTQGQPIAAVKKGLGMIGERLDRSVRIEGVGSTGSGRHLAGVMVGADVVKNEITAHAVAATAQVPGVQTVLEIGGQDSKIIILRDGVVIDFAMNTVCAAGTGSFLDQQAGRLSIPIEDFGRLALGAQHPVRIAGRCSVFAESDMIHKQQMGHSLEDIVAGLCEALVRNYLNNVGKGKEVLAPVVFQGGVAANAGMREAFNQTLGMEIIIPDHYGVMGAVGAALLAQEESTRSKTCFRGFEVADTPYRANSFDCRGCANMCEVVQLSDGEKVMARWGDRCGKWESALQTGTAS
ncbi:MAG: acyl-CoA dehydratase activase [Bacillota bacterium]